MNSFNIIKLLASFYSYYQKNKDFFAKEKISQEQSCSSQKNEDVFSATEKPQNNQNGNSFSNNKNDFSNNTSHQSAPNGVGFDTSFLKNLFPFLSKSPSQNVNASPSEINAYKNANKSENWQQKTSTPPNPLKKELLNTMLKHDLFVEKVMKNKQPSFSNHNHHP